MVSVAIAVTEKGELVTDPEIELTGVPETNAKGEAMSGIVYDAVVEALELIPRGGAAIPMRWRNQYRAPCAARSPANGTRSRPVMCMC